MGVQGTKLPDDRFIVEWGKPKEGADWEAIAAEVRQMNRPALEQTEAAASEK
jgi:hypothetical protein